MSHVIAPQTPGPELDDSMTGPPIDAAFLDRQTQGDRALQREVLSIFAVTASTFGSRLVADAAGPSMSPTVDLLALHTLKGSALAIGAHAVAKEAEALELLHATQAAIDRAAIRSQSERLKRSIDDACSFAAMLGQSL